MVTHINGVAVVAPCSTKIDYNTQATEESTRDLAGTMHVTFLASKFKLQCQWPAQTWAVRATLMSVISAIPNKASFPITFLNPFTGAYDSSINFYLGTPITQELNPDNYTMWNEVEVHFIEV